MKKILLLFLFCLTANLAAFTLSPEARISLLTCAPGEEVYARFGHTAIRVNDAANRIDEVFNYGIFDFSSSDFLYRFVKGETDYMLGTTSFDYLVWEYENRHSAVVEQVLNFTQEEKQSLFDALIINSLPENRIYRYNYFFDNCSTRPRVMVEQVCHISYQKINSGNSFRDEIYRLVGKNTWLGFGIDLLIGGRADLPFQEKENLFLPDNMMLAFENAQINHGGDVQPLVAEQRFVVNASHPSKEGGLPAHATPKQTVWLLFFAVLVLSFLFYRKNLRGVWLDMLLFGAVGLTGCVIAFLVFFSVHPAVNPNYNLLWAHPLHLLFALTLPFRAKWQQYYAAANAFVLFATLVCYAFIPQQFNPAFFPLILCLLVRSLLICKQHGRAAASQRAG